MDIETDGQSPAPTGDVHDTNAAALVEQQQAEATAAEIEDDGEEQAAQPEEGRKPAKGVQKRLDELTRQRHEAAREAEYWRQQAQLLAERLPTPTQPQATQTAPEPQRLPTLEDYNYDEAAHQAALLQHLERLAEEKATKSVETLLEKREREAREAAEQQSFQSRIAEARAKYADFDDVVFDPDLRITNDMLAVIRALPDGADVAYQLGRNPAETARIASLPPTLQAVEIGRLSARTAATQPKPNPPAPPLTIAGKGAGAGPRDPATMSDDEWWASRKASR